MNKNLLWVFGGVIIIIFGALIFTASSPAPTVPVNSEIPEVEVIAAPTPPVPESTPEPTPPPISAPAPAPMPAPTPTPTPTLAPRIVEFTVTGKNFSFVPGTLSVKKGDTVKVTFRNTGGMHDFKIDELNVATQEIQGGAEEIIQFVANKAGTFEYYCSVGTHRAMGMKGTLTVTE